MYELYAYFTNDGSVGLFSPKDDDIYHSTYGALTEAYEKFIFPSEMEKVFQKKSEIKILDICFGIGYNSKSAINYLLDFLYNETIDTNNNKYNYKIDTNNQKYKISIHAVDIDKNLIYLSPFFISNKKNLKNNNLSFKQDKIKRMLSKKIETPNKKIKLKKEVNILLFQKLFDKFDAEIETILNNKKYLQFFDREMLSLYKFYRNDRCKTSPILKINTFLHNIYYKYISSSYKNAIKALKLMDFNFSVDIADARQVIKTDSKIYDFVFLDAFTPAKCPCLWTLDFFKELYKHLDENGMILTYSNSASIRNAFINAGFYVGKIFSNSANKFTGTIAVKNKSLIKHELSEYDLGLIKTKAGIFYRDENLSLTNEAIIEAHLKEVENSDLISSSRFIKDYKRGIKNEI